MMMMIIIIIIIKAETESGSTRPGATKKLL